MAVGAMAALLAGCSDGEAPEEGQRPVLRVDLVDDAMAALEQERSGPQQYFEVNATGQLVNLFVATDGGTAAVAYVYQPEGGLQDPAPARTANGPTFGADDVSFSPDVLDRALDELETSLPTAFTVTAAPGGAGAVEYRVLFSSRVGGNLAVLVNSDGTILGSDID